MGRPVSSPQDTEGVLGFGDSPRKGNRNQGLDAKAPSICRAGCWRRELQRVLETCRGTPGALVEYSAAYM